MAALLVALTAVPGPARDGPPPTSAAAAIQAALAKEAYLTPPKVIEDAVLATRNENVSLTNLSPDGRKFLVAKRDTLPPLERLGRP